MKNILSVLFICLLFYTPAAVANIDIVETVHLKRYAEKIIDEGHVILNNKALSAEDRNKRFSHLIKTNLYLKWMAKYTLGRHRRTISKDKINEFIKIYSQFVVTVYADLADSYNGEKATVKNIKQIDDDMFIVNMEILRPGGQLPLKVDYLVHKLEDAKKNPYRISDIITEGISILNSQQAEFNSVISTRGIDALVDDLKKRIH